MVKVLPDHVAGAEVRGVEIVVVHADPVGIGGQVTAEAATVGVGAATMTAGVAHARPFATVRRDVVRPFMVPQSKWGAASARNVVRRPRRGPICK
jgi:hypothetical protein